MDTRKAIYDRLLLQTNHQIFTMDEIKQTILRVKHIQAKIQAKIPVKQRNQNFKIYKTLCFQNNNGA